MPTDPFPSQPQETGRVLRGVNDKYLVRWKENASWYVRYFVHQDDAETFLLYVKHYDPNGYAVSVASGR